MTMDTNLWARLHGASTHFPVALILSSALLDGAAFCAGDSGRQRHFRAAGFYTLILGTAGAFPGVVSGLLMTRWDSWGTGALFWHHVFVWPAFGLMVGLAVWRFLVRDQASPRAFGLYYLAVVLAAGLIGVAGYWGGELLLNG